MWSVYVCPSESGCGAANNMEETSSLSSSRIHILKTRGLFRLTDWMELPAVSLVTGFGLRNNAGIGQRGWDDNYAF